MFDEKKWSERALLVQDACNLVGIVRSLGEMMHEMVLAGWDNIKRDNHPCTILFLCKIGSMVDAQDTATFRKAYEACVAMKDKEN